MSVCADANIAGTFPQFFEVHYKLLQRILQNFDAGGLLSSGLLSVHLDTHQRSKYSLETSKYKDNAGSRTCALHYCEANGPLATLSRLQTIPL